MNKLKEICEEVLGAGPPQIPCPDKKPGCCVLHYGPPTREHQLAKSCLRMMEALEFYAKGSTWIETTLDLHPPYQSRPWLSDSGKRARAALSDVEGMVGD